MTFDAVCARIEAALGGTIRQAIVAEASKARDFPTALLRLRDGMRARPTDGTFAPLSLFFNFSQNIVKASVVDAFLWGEPRTLTLNDLLTGIPRGESGNDAKARLANASMAYARASPNRIRGRATAVIVYDPQAGRRVFADTMRQIKEY